MNGDRSNLEALKVDEVAKRLHVSPQTIRVMIERGELRAVRVGRVIRIPVEALEGFLRGEQARGAATSGKSHRRHR